MCLIRKICVRRNIAVPVSGAHGHGHRKYRKEHQVTVSITVFENVATTWIVWKAAKAYWAAFVSIVMVDHVNFRMGQLVIPSDRAGTRGGAWRSGLTISLEDNR